MSSLGDSFTLFGLRTVAVEGPEFFCEESLISHRWPIDPYIILLFIFLVQQWCWVRLWSFSWRSIFLEITWKTIFNQVILVVFLQGQDWLTKNCDFDQLYSLPTLSFQMLRISSYRLYMDCAYLYSRKLSSADIFEKIIIKPHWPSSLFFFDTLIYCYFFPTWWIPELFST